MSSNIASIRRKMLARLTLVSILAMVTGKSEKRYGKSAMGGGMVRVG